MAPTFLAARACVLEKIAVRVPEVERVDLLDAAGRVLGLDLAADRDYPPVPRSMRDGFAVRSADLPGRLRRIGEVRAGESFVGRVGPGETVEIMTGAPMPEGADQVVMVEHVHRHDGEIIEVPASPKPGDNFNERGVEAAAGQRVLQTGQRLSYPQIAELATIGVTRVPVFVKPRVAILATGDELVPIEAKPRPDQVRNSNAYSLAVQVRQAGGEPVILSPAHDTADSTRHLLTEGLEADLLLISGGVSAGKYDLVETILAELAATFFFTRVKLQPGQPLVFGQCQEKFFFGLPGNPASTMVTFELFARAAIQLLSGETPSLPLPFASLSAPLRQKAGLTRVLPAVLSADGGSVMPLSWKGSGDTAALARSNCFTVSDPEREEYAAGDWIRVLKQ
ncbi:MAG: molybdopterin molybdotransferase MoeA [Bryobacteraceae bacterium]|nr:molybdopterin molybdotransferase MoeA [Bryobacteraceae bacterium]